jgi:hypothetical protein
MLVPADSISAPFGRGTALSGACCREAWNRLFGSYFGHAKLTRAGLGPFDRVALATSVVGSPGSSPLASCGRRDAGLDQMKWIRGV